MKKSVFMAFIASVCLITSACSGQGTGVSVTSGEATTVETTEAVKNTEKPTEIETEPETKEYTAVELASKNLDEIKTIIGQLAPEHRELVNLWYLEHRPKERIMEAMHVDSLSTIYNLRNKAVAEFALLYYGSESLASI